MAAVVVVMGQSCREFQRHYSDAAVSANFHHTVHKPGIELGVALKITKYIGLEPFVVSVSLLITLSDTPLSQAEGLVDGVLVTRVPLIWSVCLFC